MDKTTQIYDRFAKELKWFIQSKIKDHTQTDDILQEVFIKIHSGINNLKNESKLRSWIYQITRNTIIDFYRKQKPNSEDFPTVDFFEEVKEYSPADRLAQSIRDMIDNLPEKYAKALCINECYSLPQQEVANQLGISLSGAKSRIQRAKQMIKDDLMKCCHYEFDKYGTLIDYHPISCCCCNEEHEHTSP